MDIVQYACTRNIDKDNRFDLWGGTNFYDDYVLVLNYRANVKLTPKTYKLRYCCPAAAAFL